ncbi:putative spherulin 4-like cell surface protein [Venturia nashicola]|uniref:Putative spherulin 4-like cell surface protein n=1 Tax=Venturia nashicola TaxID=86259 RepID=A0A4Z1PDS4_9PEZI|nr:putative spherulin 4-like cell surface protein [Venturia nashicola]TLD35974.1 putative spherulin 4-like cell surface protein [Venturia nashicola]
MGEWIEVMDSPTKNHRRQRTASQKCCLYSAITLAILIIVLVVAIPLALLLPKKNHVVKYTGPGVSTSIIVPLYTYPGNGAWNPLYEAVEKYPSKNFTVIINPESGPGATATPNEDFYPAIQKLNRFANVQTIGYVPTAYATRNITDVFQDIAIYSGWSGAKTSIAMHGIFFDEVVSDWSEDAVSYMKTINQAVKNATGLLGARTIVHNPGIIPDPRFEDSNTDITVVFESSFSEYDSKQQALTALPDARERYAYMVHSSSLAKASLQNFVNEMSQHADWLFVTNLNKNYYEKFGSNWKNFVSAIPA